jgi:hypothetical protein
LQWHKSIAFASLLAIGGLLAAGNLAAAWSRSAIPWQLDGRITRKEVRHEKHPPRDDVCLLHFDSGLVLHVDQTLFDAIEEQDQISKMAWSNRLSRNGQPVGLNLSPDFSGLTRTMPLVLAAIAISGLMALRMRVTRSGQ